jgi:hypothetical protein
VKIKLKRVLNVNDVLTTLTKYASKGNVKLHYAIAKNLIRIKPEIDALTKAQEGDEAWTAYQKKQSTAAESYARRGPDGKPLMQQIPGAPEGLMQYIPENAAEYATTRNAIEAAHHDLVEKRKLQEKAVQAMLEEAIDFNFYTIPLALIEEDMGLKAEIGDPHYQAGMPPLGMLLEHLVDTVIRDD